MIVDKNGNFAFNKDEENFLIKKLAKMMKATIYFEAEHNAKNWLADLKRKNENHAFNKDDEISIPYKISFNGTSLIAWVAERELDGKEDEFQTKILQEIENLRKLQNNKRGLKKLFKRGD